MDGRPKHDDDGVRVASPAAPARPRPSTTGANPSPSRARMLTKNTVARKRTRLAGRINLSPHLTGGAG